MAQTVWRDVDINRRLTMSATPSFKGAQPRPMPSSPYQPSTRSRDGLRLRHSPGDPASVPGEVRFNGTIHSDGATCGNHTLGAAVGAPGPGLGAGGRGQTYSHTRVHSIAGF